MVTLSDISGSEHLVQTIRENIVAPLKAGSPDGRTLIIIYGPPGTGKTFVGKAIAGELGLDITVVKASEGDDVIAGFGASTSEGVVFFDEIDKLEERGILGDALESLSENVLVVGGTYYPWKLKDLKFSGTLSTIFLPEPGLEARKSILSEFLGEKRGDVDVEKIAVLTEGYTASDIHALIKNSDFDEIEETISQTKPTTLSDWILAVKENEDQLDPIAYKKLLEWIRER